MKDYRIHACGRFALSYVLSLMIYGFSHSASLPAYTATILYFTLSLILQHLGCIEHGVRERPERGAFHGANNNIFLFNPPPPAEEAYLSFFSFSLLPDCKKE